MINLTNEKNKRKYLVYKITNRFNNKIYIGCHSTLNVDDKYMGSGTEIKEAIKKEGKKSFIKEILHVFDNKEDMIRMEAELVNKEFCHRIDTYNRMIGGIYTNIGMISAKDKNDNFFYIYNDDPRYLSGELVSIINGKLNVKDKDGNTFRIDKDDPRYLSGELVGCAKGIKFKQNINSSFKGKKHSKETLKKMSKPRKKSNNPRNPRKPRKKSNNNKRKFYIYDLMGNFISEKIGINEYAKEINISKNCIIAALTGRTKKCKNIRFFYEYQGIKLS